MSEMDHKQDRQRLVQSVAMRRLKRLMDIWNDANCVIVLDLKGQRIGWRAYPVAAWEATDAFDAPQTLWINMEIVSDNDNAGATPATGGAAGPE